MPTTLKRNEAVPAGIHDEVGTAIELFDETNVEHQQLRKVHGPLPWRLFAICVIEMGERFVYIGISGPLQNYIQIPYPHNANGVPGALGRGQQVGVALGNFFKFWAYFCTVLGAIVADQFLGKYKAIIAANPVYITGLIILIATATPAAINANASMGGLIAAMITIGLGTGCLKASIAPMCGEQIKTLRSYVTTTKSGERVVVDAELTSARVFMWYYWAANIGSLSSLATTSIEKKHSFWLAFLLVLLVFILALCTFLGFSSKIVKIAPTGSPIVDAWRTILIAFREKGFHNAAPSALRSRGRLQDHSFARQERYTDSYVADIKSGVRACKYFILFPFYFLVWIQSFSNLVSQAGSMRLGSTPNDLMNSLQTILMLGFIPILDLFVYPFLRTRFGIVLNPIKRIFFGFISAALGMAYACVLQHFIYVRPEHSVFVWIQAPAYFFIALSEIWVIITGLEVAFLKAPDSLRAFVSSVFWLTIAIGSAIGIAMAPASKNPHMVWLYGSLSIAAFVAGCIFFLWFKDDLREGITLAGEGLSMDEGSKVVEGKLQAGQAGGPPSDAKHLRDKHHHDDIVPTEV